MCMNVWLVSHVFFFLHRVSLILLTGLQLVIDCVFVCVCASVLCVSGGRCSMRGNLKLSLQHQVFFFMSLTVLRTHAHVYKLSFHSLPHFLHFLNVFQIKSLSYSPAQEIIIFKVSVFQNYIDFHCMDIKRSKDNFFQNVFFCVPQKIECHTGLERVDARANKLTL